MGISAIVEHIVENRIEQKMKPLPLFLQALRNQMSGQWRRFTGLAGRYDCFKGSGASGASTARTKAQHLPFLRYRNVRQADKTAVGNATDFVLFRLDSGGDRLALLGRKTRVPETELNGLKPLEFVKFDVLTGQIERGKLTRSESQ